MMWSWSDVVWMGRTSWGPWWLISALNLQKSETKHKQETKGHKIIGWRENWMVDGRRVLHYEEATLHNSGLRFAMAGQNLWAEPRSGEGLFAAAYPRVGFKFFSLCSGVASFAATD